VRTVRIVGIVVVAAAGALTALLAYASWIAGPGLSAHRIGDRIHVEGRFLGEYSLGFERVRIEDAATGAVICDVSGRTSADLDLRPGANTPATMFERGATVQFRVGAGTCRLSSGHGYRVTAWGNNGWGSVRPSSIHVRF
jgi:hypothetical protein